MIFIRKAKESDFPRIFEIEARSYPPKLHAPNEVLIYRFKTFGIWVAELNGVVVGFFTCVPAKINWPNFDTSKIIANRKPHYKPWFEEYVKLSDFDTLIVTSAAVEDIYQNRGVGTELVSYSLKLAKEMGFSYRASALRCEYKKYFDQTGKSVIEYLEEVKSGKIHDKFLSIYLKLGFELSCPLPNYEPNEESLDYNIFAFKRFD